MGLSLLWNAPPNRDMCPQFTYDCDMCPQFTYDIVKPILDKHRMSFVRSHQL